MRPSGRVGFRVALGLVGAVLALGLVSGAPAAGSPGSTPTTAVFRICTNCTQFGLIDGSRYSYVVLHSWQAGLIGGLKAQNPNLKALVYKNVSGTYSYACHSGVDDPAIPAGIGYCWAAAGAPDMFLTDTSGRRIEFSDYPGIWLMDVGDPGYQQRWLDNVAADATSKGFDGVFLDDVNQDSTGHLGGRTIAKYPGGSDWAAAVTRFLAVVGPGLQNRGLLVLPNIMIRNWWESSGIALFDSWLAYTSGTVQEYYSKWNLDSSGWFTDDGGWHNDWTYRQEFLKRTQAAGKIFIGLTYAPAGDARSQRYARASFLADWDGGRSALAFEPTDPDQQDPYTPTWTTDLGSPLGPRYKVGLAWRRDFTLGAVVVNPSTSTQTVELGNPFVRQDGTTVTSVVLQPADGALLRLPSSPPPPTPSVTVSSSIPDGSTLSGSLAWTATAAQPVSKVDFHIDGALRWTDSLAPYQFNGDGEGRLDTTTLANGSHSLEVVATTGETTARATATVQVSNAAPSPPPAVDSLPPSTPTGLTVTSTDVTRVSLSWDASTDDVGVAGYRVYRGGAYQATTASTSFGDGGLAPATTYTYSIRAVDGAGNLSAASLTAKAKTAADRVPPTIPENLTASPVDATHIRLTWESSTDNVATVGYRVYRGGKYWASTTSTVWVDSSALPGKTYSYVVKAFDGAGKLSSASNPAEAMTTDTTPPSAPSLAVRPSGASAALTWTASTDDVRVTGYRVYRDGTLLRALSRRARNLTDSTGSKGTYAYVVVAVDAADNAGVSNVATATF